MSFVLPDDWIVDKENKKRRKRQQPEDQPQEQPHAPSPIPVDAPDPHEMPADGNAPVPEMPDGGLPERPTRPQTDEQAPERKDRGVTIIPLVPDEEEDPNVYDIRKESANDVPAPDAPSEDPALPDVPPDDAFEE